jgi:hypothetical protein
MLPMVFHGYDINDIYLGFYGGVGWQRGTITIISIVAHWYVLLFHILLQYMTREG